MTISVTGLISGFAQATASAERFSDDPTLLAVTMSDYD